MVQLFLFYALLQTVSLFGEISALYLSWYDNPATTMTIQWHTPPGESDAIRLELPDGIKSFTGTHYPFPNEPLVIHTVQLQDLKPDTEYTFQITNSPKKYKFRTAPLNLEQPLRFVVGGDLYLSPELFRKMSQTVVAQDPLFAAVGGDLAYAVENPSLFSNKPTTRWRAFLADWTKSLQTPSGRLIPLLVVSGNHDLTPDLSELFFTLFNFPQKTLYRMVDFGSYLSLILLDTGHLSPITGLQTEWLQETLSKRASLPYLFAVYHVGAYPSFYSFEGKAPNKIRTNWCPLFDQYGVQAAFEHHSHTYKRTFPLKAGQKAPSGTIYFGDGCWGVKPRKVRDAWYLEKSGSKNHVYLIEMTGGTAKVSAIGLNGELIDKVEIQPHTIKTTEQAENKQLTIY
jgi:hypothetical protein